MSLVLSPQQQKVVAAGLTTFAAIIVATAVVAVFYFSAKFFQAFNHVFLPLAVAAVFALVLEPWYDWLRLRAHLPSVIALIVVFLSLIIPVSLIFVFFGALIFSQLTELIDQIPVLWDNLVTWAKQQRPELERFFKTNSIGKSISEAFKSPGGPVAAIADYLMESAVHAGATIISGIVTFMGWVILPVYLAFFLLMPKLRPDSLTTDHLPFLKPETAADAIYLAKEFVQLVVVFFRGQILIALIQGILFAIGFSLAGLKYGAVLGLMLGFLNIVPYLGSMVGLSVCLPMAWFQAGGGSTTLALVIAVFTIVQAIEGYFLTPKIMGDRTDLNPLVIIVGIFFWGAALNGILGMILAIPLTAFLVVLWRLAREKYIGQMF
jgi:predicted PurR-regulated permease PerM